MDKTLNALEQDPSCVGWMICNVEHGTIISSNGTLENATDIASTITRVFCKFNFWKRFDHIFRSNAKTQVHAKATFFHRRRRSLLISDARAIRWDESFIKKKYLYLVVIQKVGNRPFESEELTSTKESLKDE